MTAASPATKALIRQFNEGETGRDLIAPFLVDDAECISDYDATRGRLMVYSRASGAVVVLTVPTVIKHLKCACQGTLSGMSPADRDSIDWQALGRAILLWLADLVGALEV